jgi:hypothetical protein
LGFERQAANLLFALVARRYERGSIILTSNRGCEAWGDGDGDGDGARGSGYGLSALRLNRDTNPRSGALFASPS